PRCAGRGGARGRGTGSSRSSGGEGGTIRAGRGRPGRRRGGGGRGGGRARGRRGGAARARGGPRPRRGTRGGGGRGGSGGGGGPEATSGAEAARGEVKVRVVGVDGTAQTGLEFEIVAPDGTRHAGKTDDQGSLKVDGLPQSGECTLDLPDVTPAPQADATVQGRIRFVEGGVK